MTDNDSADSRPPTGPWIVAFTLTLMAAIAGFVVAVQQFVVKYLIDNWAHTRTLVGVLFMLLGVAGVSAGAGVEAAKEGSDVDADEPITFSVEGLERVKMTRGDEPMDGSDSLSGRFHVTIVGQP